jgi:hypothetical protein
MPKSSGVPETTSAEHSAPPLHIFRPRAPDDLAAKTRDHPLRGSGGTTKPTKLSPSIKLRHVPRVFRPSLQVGDGLHRDHRGCSWNAEHKCPGNETATICSHEPSAMRFGTRPPPSQSGTTSILVIARQAVNSRRDLQAPTMGNLGIRRSSRNHTRRHRGAAGDDGDALRCGRQAPEARPEPGSPNASPGTSLPSSRLPIHNHLVAHAPTCRAQEDVKDRRALRRQPSPSP